jgi:drug/metabolite transporter (DMT)-like permease
MPYSIEKRTLIIVFLAHQKWISNLSLWIPITLVAAFFQNIRSSLQKYLKGRMGTTGATFVRFGFGMPFVLALVAILHFQIGYSFPPLSARFFAWMMVGALSQIAATFLLVHLFSFRNFAVGTAYSRTEPAQAAVFGLLFLGEAISPAAIVAIAICVFGVMLISMARSTVSVTSLITSLGQRTAIIGLISGAGFGLSAVAYRGASLALGGPNFFMQAAVTLGFAISFQTLVMFVWILAKEPEQMPLIAQAWKPSLLVGIVGASASLGWFSAMTLQNSAVVKALAQVEMLFAFATSVFIFKEKINRFELIGCLLIVAGIIFLMIFR